MPPVSRWRAWADAALSWSLGPPCAICEQVLTSPLSGAACESCWRALVRITPPLCDRCGEPLSTSGDPHRNCALGSVTKARAVGEYAGTLRELIHALKYSHRRSLAAPLSRAMRVHGHDVLEGADAVVPVPLHPRRRRQRGFNQADLLARSLGVPVLRVLRRVQHTAPQVDLAAPARHQNVAQAFALRQPWLPPLLGGRLTNHTYRSIDAAVLVLVDDVTTTGATLEACARTLKAAGAREVRALTAARVVASFPQAPVPRGGASGAFRRA